MIERNPFMGVRHAASSKSGGAENVKKERREDPLDPIKHYYSIKTNSIS